MDIEERIIQDIRKFDDSVRKFNLEKAKRIKDEDFIKILELAKMYASDSNVWLKKHDYYTAFASISYAHGLLDALLKLLHIIE
ncbi:MAG: DUF357 domain-containing protein [Candidatus Micrarchaeia archaeon]|jgi:hypothetical protein